MKVGAGAGAEKNSFGSATLPNWRARSPAPHQAQSTANFANSEVGCLYINIYIYIYIYLYLYLNPKNIKIYFIYESVFVAKLAHAVYGSVSDPDAHSISPLDPDPGVNFALPKN